MVRTTLIALAGVALLAVPVSAQHYRADFGLNGGFAWYTDALDDENLGIDDAEDVKFESGWLLGAQLTGWLTPRFGLRANFAYNERPLVTGSYDELDGNDNSTDLVNDVNLWSGSGDLMWRFVGPQRFFARQALPYLALGVGAKWINPVGGTTFTNEIDGEEQEGVIFGEPQTGEAFLLAEDTKLMGLAALGTDIRLARNFGLRLEIGDRFWDAPLHRVDFDPATGFFLPEGDEDVGKVIHELYGTIGLHFLMGVEPEVVAIAPVPAPPPPPPVAPAEESITVCVVDPTTRTGLRMVNAIYVPSRGDTLVVVNGQRRDFYTTVGNVTVVRDADWFIAGRPLAITAGTDDIEFVTYGGSRLIEANHLVFLGTVNGVPMYADANDVAAFRADLDRELAMGTDLESALRRNTMLRTRLAEVDVIYTPLQPVGCVFQPLQRLEEVRKSN